MKMRNGFKLIEVEYAPTAAEALAAKDAALKATLAYIESRGGDTDWWRDEQSFRTHRLVKRALEAGAEQTLNHNGHGRPWA